MSDSAAAATAGEQAAAEPIAWLREHAEWLFDQEVGTCLVGTHALAIALQQAGHVAPAPRDIDLAWALDTEQGMALLSKHDALMATTDGSLERGTLAMKLGRLRFEVTTLRDSDSAAPLHERIPKDLAARDMTAGALAVELATGKLHDPHDGLGDYLARRVVAVGDAAERVREHPVRWLRYFRKAHEWGFEVDNRIRKLDLPPALLDSLPTEAIAGELRAALVHGASPGRFFLDLHEVGLLRHLAPELDLQFDGRPAGPQRWHPEVSQALHMVLALEWAAARAKDLGERDRLAVMFAVLCHDLGKGYTEDQYLPGHPGHERMGLQPLEDLAARFPGLVDNSIKSLARAVCELHVQVRLLADQRAGTLVRLYDRYLRPKDFPVQLFALAVAADSGGRLGLSAEGDQTFERVSRDLEWLRAACRSVDAAAVRSKHPDLDAFKSALHEAQANAIADVRKAQRQQS